jgi:hypothetical protein
MKIDWAMNAKFRDQCHSQFRGQYHVNYRSQPPLLGINIIGCICLEVINAKRARTGWKHSYSRAMAVERRHVGDAGTGIEQHALTLTPWSVNEDGELHTFGLPFHVLYIILLV